MVILISMEGKISGEREMFELILKRLFDIENQIAQSLPNLLNMASDEKLKNSLNNHFEVTKLQRDRLTEISGALGIEISGENDKVIELLLKEVLTRVESATDPQIRDMELIFGCDIVEHYEMSVYNGAITLASKLDEDNAKDMLYTSREEESTAAKTLEGLSESDGLIGTLKKAVM